MKWKDEAHRNMELLSASVEEKVKLEAKIKELKTEIIRLKKMIYDRED